MDITAIVTGGAGFIGSHLAARLLSLGCTVIVIDNLAAGDLRNLPHSERLHFFNADVRDEAVRDIYREFRPKVLFHLAAHFANELSIEEPAEDLSVNAEGTLNQLRLALDAGVGRFVYASSSCVYASSSEPLAESAQLDPHTPYGISKLAGEQYCRFFSTYHGLPVTIIRYFNVYGPREPANRYRGVVPRFMAQAARGLPLVIRGDGQDTRDFTYVDDAVGGTIQAAFAEGAGGEVFNIGTGQSTSLIDLVESIRSLCGSGVPVRFEPRRIWDLTFRRTACIDHARRLVGYCPSTTLEAGLATTWEWYAAEASESVSRTPAARKSRPEPVRQPGHSDEISNMPDATACGEEAR